MTFEKVTKRGMNGLMESKRDWAIGWKVEMKWRKRNGYLEVLESASRIAGYYQTHISSES